MLFTLALLACTPPDAGALDVLSEADLLSLSSDDFVAGRVVLPDDGETPTVDGQALLLERELTSLGLSVWELPAGMGTIDGVLALRDQHRYGFVEPDITRGVMALDVDDPYAAHQWHLETIGMDEAWQRATGEGVVVAVIDSGIGTAGDDTPNLTLGWDFVDDDPHPIDEHRHGTHVAGTIAQPTDNGVGTAGVAPDAMLMPLRVLNANNRGSVTNIAAAIEMAADHGADVANLSLGGSVDSATERAAVEYAEASGLLMVAAAGNSGLEEVLYPAAYDAVIAVGATDSDDQPTTYSAWGDTIELAAPGGKSGASVYQETFQGDGTDPQDYKILGMSGTSMAAPHVTGVAALLLEHGLTGDEVRQVLVDTAVDVHTSGWDAYTGYGRVDAAAALEAVLGAPSEAPELCGVEAEASQWARQVTGTVNQAATVEICFESHDCVELEADGAFDSGEVWAPWSDTFSVRVTGSSGTRTDYGPWTFSGSVGDACAVNTAVGG